MTKGGRVASIKKTPYESHGQATPKALSSSSINEPALTKFFCLHCKTDFNYIELEAHAPVKYHWSINDILTKKNIRLFAQYQTLLMALPEDPIEANNFCLPDGKVDKYGWQCWLPNCTFSMSIRTSNPSGFLTHLQTKEHKNAYQAHFKQPLCPSELNRLGVLQKLIKRRENGSEIDRIFWKELVKHYGINSTIRPLGVVVFHRKWKLDKYFWQQTSPCLMSTRSISSAIPHFLSQPQHHPPPPPPPSVPQQQSQPQPQQPNQQPFSWSVHHSLSDNEDCLVLLEEYFRDIEMSVFLLDGTEDPCITFLEDSAISQLTDSENTKSKA